MCRYTGLADWDYIGQCAQGCGDLQLIGNGDVFTHQAYEARLKAAPGLATAMIARAALIKPWLFTEVISGCAGMSQRACDTCCTIYVLLYADTCKSARQVSRANKGAAMSQSGFLVS